MPRGDRALCMRAGLPYLCTDIALHPTQGAIARATPPETTPKPAIAVKILPHDGRIAPLAGFPNSENFAQWVKVIVQSTPYICFQTI